jgi:hypothetical protein
MKQFCTLVAVGYLLYLCCNQYYGMAWRSHGRDNTDMVRNLRGNDHLFLFCEYYSFDEFGCKDEKFYFQPMVLFEVRLWKMSCWKWTVESMLNSTHIWMLLRELAMESQLVRLIWYCIYCVTCNMCVLVNESLCIFFFLTMYLIPFMLNA